MNDTELEAQRHFPTVKMGDNGIVLAEYNAASARCQADERAITITNGLLVAGTTAILPVLAPLIESLFSQDIIQRHIELSLAMFLLGWGFITSVISSYVCELRKAYVFAARKVIVIRRMLGQSYGRFALVLPTWRLEGADDPLAIKLFPGWRLIQGYALYATVFLSTVPTWLAVTTALSHSALVQTEHAGSATLTLTVLWAAYWLASIRYKLFDTHESFALSFARLFSSLLRVQLHDNIHSLLYRAQLSRTEGHRLKLDFGLVAPLAIFREDRRFHQHRGVDLRSVLRAFRDWARRTPSGGASTITQQLARTLFIVDLRKRVRRKIIEVLLAIWLEGKLSKNEILETYITSVRYDRGVFGFIAARKHFFGSSKGELTAAEALLLMERVANVKGLFRGHSIERMLADALKLEVIDRQKALDVLERYEQLIERRLISIDGSVTPQAIRDKLAQWK